MSEQYPHETPPDEVPAMADFEAVEPVPASPEEAVDDFLESTQELFNQVERGWAGVKVAQTNVVTQQINMVSGTISPLGSLSSGQDIMKSLGIVPRHVERDGIQYVAEYELTSSLKKTIAVIYESSSRHAYNIYRAKVAPIRQGMTEQDLDDLYDGISTKEKVELFPEDDLNVSMSTETRHKAYKMASDASSSPDEGNPLMAMQDTITKAYTKAYLFQDQAADAVESLLVDDPLRVAPFLAKLAEAAEFARYGYTEYPGLLETLASRVAMDHKHKRLVTAVEQADISLEELKRDFLGRYFTMTEAGVKAEHRDITAVVIGMRMVAQTVTGELGVNPDDLLTKLTANYDSWPASLQTKFETSLKHATAQKGVDFKNLLSPFNRRGRRPPVGTLDANSLKSVSGISFRNPSTNKKRGGKRQTPQHHAADSVTDLGTQLVVSEREPVDSFGVLRTVDGTSHRALEMVRGINGLLDHPMLSDFVAKYPDQTALHSDLLRLIDFLSENPLDTDNTSRLSHIHSYELRKPGGTSDEHTRRQLRMFTPAKISGVEIGGFNSRIRMLYDIVLVGGEPSILVDGIYLKQEEV